MESTVYGVCLYTAVCMVYELCQVVIRPQGAILLVQTDSSEDVLQASAHSLAVTMHLNSRRPVTAWYCNIIGEKVQRTECLHTQGWLQMLSAC